MQRFGRSLEQDVVDHPLVLEGDRRDLFGDGEDNVEVRHGQQVGLAVAEPLRAGERLTLRTVPVTAGVIGDALMTAGVALFDVATQHCGTTLLDRTHDATLRAAERVGMHVPIGWAVATQNVRQFQRGTHDRTQPFVGGGSGQMGVAGR